MVISLGRSYANVIFRPASLVTVIVGQNPIYPTGPVNPVTGNYAPLSDVNYDMVETLRESDPSPSPPPTTENSRDCPGDESSPRTL